MRSVQGLFLVSAALFISAIAFVIAGARASQRQPVAADRPALTAVASVRQLMTSLVVPNAKVVYQAVGWTITAAGTVEVVPRNDQEWTAVADSAAALVESGNLLLVGDRAVDNGEWVMMTRTFMAAAEAARQAAEQKSVDGVFGAGSDLNETCDRCHARYSRR